VSDQPDRNRSRFYTYPMHRMVAILDDGAGLKTALGKLQEVGADVAHVDVLTGPEGARLLDRWGKRHGFLGRLLRLLQWSASENDALDVHADALENGRHVVYVPVRGEDQKARVATALRAAGGHHLIYFGRWTTEKQWL
jgi:hypothetical protein